MPKIESDLDTALRLLRDYFAEKRIAFVLVGALVPALLLSSRVGARETRDADHVIELASWADWEAVIAGLVALGFTRASGEQEHRLHYRQAVIDLIPYGISSGPDEILVWRKSGNQMNLAGFSDVFRYAIETEVTPGLTLPIVPLWLFAVLKVIAYLDRGFPRDMRDLAFVLEHYEVDGGRRFDMMSKTPGMTYESAGAYLLGSDIAAHGSRSSVGKVITFVEAINDEYHAVIQTVLRDENRLFSEERRQALYQLFALFRQGLASVHG